jgi:hypothetical protein
MGRKQASVRPHGQPAKQKQVANQTGAASSGGSR